MYHVMYRIYALYTYFAVHIIIAELSLPHNCPAYLLPTLSIVREYSLYIYIQYTYTYAYCMIWASGRRFGLCIHTYNTYIDRKAIEPVQSCCSSSFTTQ